MKLPLLLDRLMDMMLALLPTCWMSSRSTLESFLLDFGVDWEGVDPVVSWMSNLLMIDFESLLFDFGVCLAGVDAAVTALRNSLSKLRSLDTRLDDLGVEDVDIVLAAEEHYTSCTGDFQLHFS